jgi:hypothetical protein
MQRRASNLVAANFGEGAGLRVNSYLLFSDAGPKAHGQTIC